MSYAPRVMLTIITLRIGLWIIGAVVNLMRRSLETTKTGKKLFGTTK